MGADVFLGVQSNVCKGTSCGKDGMPTTWIDFVLTSKGVPVAEESSKTWPDFVMPRQGFDHVPTAVVAFPQVKMAQCTSNRRRAAYNRQATKDSVRQQVFQEMVALIVPPAANVEPTSHAWLLDQAVNWAACIAFGPPLQRTPKQSYMSDEAMNCVTLRRKALVTANYAGRMIGTAPAKATFKAWANRKRPWKYHCVFGLARPWAVCLRVKQVMLQGRLHEQTANNLRDNYAAKVREVTKHAVRDINIDHPGKYP